MTPFSGTHKVQRQATYVTASHEDDGFAKAVEEFILPGGSRPGAARGPIAALSPGTALPTPGAPPAGGLSTARPSP